MIQQTRLFNHSLKCLRSKLHLVAKIKGFGENQICSKKLTPLLSEPTETQNYIGPIHIIQNNLFT